MKGQTFVLRDGKLVPKEQAPLKPSGAFFMADIQPFRTQDGTNISSRSHLRAYEQTHGIKQVGNDFREQHRELRQKVYGSEHGKAAQARR